VKRSTFIVDILDKGLPRRRWVDGPEFSQGRGVGNVWI